MNQLEKQLNKYFGYPTFRPGQKEIIEDILNGKHVFATLPTGSGKSICYQLPSMMIDGKVIVVTPLLSLMEDQVKQLKKRGFKQAVAINSFNTTVERRSILNQLDAYQLIYLSPEMLQNKYVITKLRQLKISLFVIDEAHCISQWGHEFRPDYLKLNQAIEHLGDPTILALTATATPDVQKDIINHFYKIKFTKHIYPIDRDNISLIVEQLNHRSEKDAYLINLFQKWSVPTIIYFTSRKEAERVATLLGEKFSQLSVSYYHGELETSERLLIQEQFMENQIDIICATSAFGMGIDKQNIRLVIHYHIPTQLESLIQEIGRAGRDQLSSVSISLIAPNDDILPRRLIETELPSTEMVESLFASLLHIQQSETTISLNQAFIHNHWPINEVQRRFIQDYFAENDLMTQDGRIELHKIIPQIKHDLIKRVEQRSRYKLGKLDELFQWLTAKECRRQALYQSFQSTVREAKYHCCDQCGFTLEQWSPEYGKRGRELKSWQAQLQSILLPFESGGTGHE
ncbi:MAG TPA: ATP-dependent DNA helicase RecQ [Bacilli bacterium]|nr:ATP-dependent DNA helicase RecQ [Bacilli bacterium]